VTVVSKFVPIGNPAAATSAASNATLIAALTGALAAATGIFHVSRKQLEAVASRVWAMVEPELADAEVLEAAAMATRRLPTAGVAGRLGRRASLVRKDYRHGFTNHNRCPHAHSRDIPLLWRRGEQGS